MANAKTKSKTSRFLDAGKLLSEQNVLIFLVIILLTLVGALIVMRNPGETEISDPVTVEGSAE